MSDNTPTFNDVLGAIGTLLNVGSTSLFDELFEDAPLSSIDVQLSSIPFLKGSKTESGEKADDYSAVDEALDQLGVDKPDDEESVECGGGADCIRCAANEKARSSTEERAVEKKEPALSTWRITPPHDSWGDETVEAETLDIDPIEGIYAYNGDDLVFHAPAGTYHYVRKVG